MIREFNEDRSFDRFVREQLAGDELPGFAPGGPVSPEVADRLIATHFLRNGQDGSGESDGNPDELRVDRYAALESCQQIVASSLLGLTIQCAKCHAHKFEPITHEDYYRFQAIFAPVFPAATDSLWIKPQARFVVAPTPDQKQKWEGQLKETTERVAKLQAELGDWVKGNRPKGNVLFLDEFDPEIPLACRWSNTAPTDNRPGGKIAVTPDGEKPPAARNRRGHLEIIAGGTLDSWITTTRAFDWTPDAQGDSIQATFDLVNNRLTPDGKPAERVGYYIATHDFDDDGQVAGGNILVDGHPSGSTTVYLDYPGSDSTSKGAIGRTGYVPGRNYGVRVTNIGKGQFRLEHLVDGFAEEGSLTLAAADLPDGGFGFEYHADRSFVVDNIRIERFPAAAAGEGSSIASRDEEFNRRRKELQSARHDESIERQSAGQDRVGIRRLADAAGDAPPRARRLCEAGRCDGSVAAFRACGPRSDVRDHRARRCPHDGAAAGVRELADGPERAGGVAHGPGPDQPDLARVFRRRDRGDA